MISIADTVTPERVELGLIAFDQQAAIRQVADLLQNVSAVLDWETLYKGLCEASPCLAESGGEFSICLPHTRTDAVSSMVMSVGRFDSGVAFPKCPQPVRYIFCIGVPKALANDYLRIVGLLVRILREPVEETRLFTAETPSDFVDRLSALEAKL